MAETVELTKNECTSLCDFIEFNLLDAIRNDPDIDSLEWLANIMNVFQRMAEFCNYSGYSIKNERRPATSVRLGEKE